MSNFEIITLNDTGSFIEAIRFNDFGVDIKKENFDNFIKFRPTGMDEWVEKTKDCVCLQSVSPYLYGWNQNHPLFEKLKYSPYEARIFKTSKNWDYKLDEKVYLFKEDAIIQFIINLNEAIKTDYCVVVKPNLLARSLEGLVDVQEKLDTLLRSDTVESLASEDKTNSSEDSKISDFVKLNTLMGKLYEKDSSKLKKHLKKAYLEISLIDTIKTKFNKNDEDAGKILYALNRVYWLVENKKFSFENAKIKVSEEFGISVDGLSSLSASRSSFKKHMKKI